MSTPTNKETLAVNSKGQTERRAETVDHRSSAGQSNEQKKPVQVIHQPHASYSKSNTSGGALANAAASVATTLQSAKEAISRD